MPCPRSLVLLPAMLLAAASAAPAHAAVVGTTATGTPVVFETTPPALVAGELGVMRAERNLEALIEGGREAAGEADEGAEAEREREGGPAVQGEDREEEGRPTPKANPDALDTVPRAPLRRGAGQKVAVTSTSGFDGPTLTDTGAFPPDTQGDVGPSQYVVAINGRIRSYTKSTGVADGVLNVSPDTFFASVMTPTGTGGIVGNFTSDPHIRYDRLSQRWYIVIIDVPYTSASPFTTAANRFLLAVSDGPTISGATVWSKLSWDEDLNGRTDAQFADYPTLGIDSNALYIGANMFGSSGNGSFSGTRAYVVQKSALLAATPSAVVTRFPVVSTSTGAGGFTPQGVDDRTGDATVGWFVGVDNAVFSQLDFYKVTNPGSATPTLSAAIPLTVPTTAYPKTVPHSGNTGGTNGNLDALDDRLFAANLRNGHIWTAHAIGVTSAGVASGSATRNGSRWYDVTVSSGSPVLSQSGTVFDTAATTPKSYWIPTVNVNGQGTMAMGGSVAGGADRINTFFTGRKATDTPGTTDAPTLATSTGAAYNPSSDAGGASGRRWGDYSFVSVDPDDDQTMWSIQEYTSATNLYGTRITKLRAAAPTFATITPSALVRQPRVTHLTMTGTGFFDPGAAFAKRLAVTSDCGATDLAITGTPTPTTITFDATAPASGPCLFTATNPDGQAVASTAVTTPVNQAPVAAGDAASTPRDTPLNGPSVLENDTDFEGDTLTAQKETDPTHGTVVLASDGTYVYTPAAGYAGSDAFTYKASDGDLTSAAATVTITVTATNRRPGAVDDTGVTVRDTALSGTSVLANDTDADGNTLHATKASDPAHGTVAVALDGTYVYAPAPGYTGPDAFAYDADDGALSARATVRLTVLAPAVTNRPPVTATDKGTTPRGTVLKGTSVLANDNDPDGDALTAVKAGDPKHGKVTLAPSGTYVYTPMAGYVGPDAFTYRAADGKALSPATMVALTVTQPKTCRVPRTRGLTLKRAKAALKKAGCTSVKTVKVRTTQVGRSRVISSSPRAGARIAASRRVTLKVRR